MHPQKSKKIDAYICRCLREGKIDVDYKTGDVICCRLGRPYKLLENRAGYKYLSLKFYNKRYGVFVHRIIWLAVAGRIRKGYVIDHLDHNPANNCLSNLRCVTHKENCRNRRLPQNGGNNFVKVVSCHVQATERTHE